MTPPASEGPRPDQDGQWDAWAADAPTPSESTWSSATAAPQPQTAPPVPAGSDEQPAPEPTWPAPPPNRSPRWARWTLAGLLAATAVLYLWGLSRNGWANSYYSAAAQAAGDSWKAWFFGSFDSANAITVDKPPASLWLMGLSVRLFGLSSWSILVPQALLGVAAVGVLYASVRRWFGPAAGLIAGVVLALTPVATLMFRFNNPDALLVFLFVAAAWAMTRATERGALRWILLAGALVGLAFLTKMLQAFLVLPGFVAMYAVAAPTTWPRRLGHLLAAFAAMVVSAGWWVAVVELWPASSRPYIGGSQTNSVIELIFGYNGFGRLTGNETGSVGAGGGQGGRWGETGLGRLFSSSYGGQIAWLLPAALAMIIVLLLISRTGPRTDRVRAATIGWGGWLLVTAAVISFSQGIIHEYYSVALAPAIGALVGIGAAALWAHRARLWARVVAAGVVVGSGLWAGVLLERSSAFLPWLAPLVIAGSLLVGLAFLLLAVVPARIRPAVGIGAALAGLLVLVAGPAAYSVQTASSTASGSLPTAGPTVAGSRGTGAPGARGTGGSRAGQGGPGARPGGSGQDGSGQPPTGPGPSAAGGDGLGQQPAQGGSSAGGSGPGGSSAGGSSAGGSLLEGSSPSDELTALLLTDADQYTWVAATVGANTASGYQLATQRPVMAVGGFNGTDPAPTLEQFQQAVADGQIHYFISGGTGAGGGFGQANGGSQEASRISTWVSENFTATTVGGITVYDLTNSPSAATGSDAGGSAV